jgi:hypothetical protein
MKWNHHNTNQKEDFKMIIDKMIIQMITDVNKLSEKRDYNKYIKKHPIEKIFMLLLLQQYSGFNNGRAFSLYTKRMIGNTTDTLSQGELSKKLCYRLPVELFHDMFKIQLGRLKGKQSKEIRKIKKFIRIIDSTALPATSTMNYAKHRRNKNGFKLHTVIDEEYIPDDVRLKNGRSSDKKSLKWAIQPGYIHIFDRGYNDYSQFRWIKEKQAYFVTRALVNIKYSIIQSRKVGHRQKEKGIISDRIIEVIEDRKKDIKYRMRMVTFGFIDSTGRHREFSLLTNLMENRSDEITELYRKRWNIEVVFRWIKMFLKIERWLSRSKNGVLIQICTALCAYIMVLLARMNDSKKYHIMKDAIYEFIHRLKIVIGTFVQNSNIEELFLESS